MLAVNPRFLAPDVMNTEELVVLRLAKAVTRALSATQAGRDAPVGG
jgi:hypothetical protein